MPTRSVQTRSSCDVNSYGCSQEQVESALTSLFMGDPFCDWEKSPYSPMRFPPEVVTPASEQMSTRVVLSTGSTWITRRAACCRRQSDGWRNDSIWGMP